MMYISGCCCHHCRRCAVAAATPSPVTGSAGGGGTVVVELHLLSLVLNCGTCCSTEGRLHQDRGRPGFSSVNAHTPPPFLHPHDYLSYTPTTSTSPPLQRPSLLFNHSFPTNYPALLVLLQTILSVHTSCARRGQEDKLALNKLSFKLDKLLFSLTYNSNSEFSSASLQCSREGVLLLFQESHRKS